MITTISLEDIDRRLSQFFAAHHALLTYGTGLYAAGPDPVIGLDLSSLPGLLPELDMRIVFSRPAIDFSQHAPPGHVVIASDIVLTLSGASLSNVALQPFARSGHAIDLRFRIHARCTFNFATSPNQAPRIAVTDADLQGDAPEPLTTSLVHLFTPLLRAMLQKADTADWHFIAVKCALFAESDG